VCCPLLDCSCWPDLVNCYFENAVVKVLRILEFESLAMRWNQQPGLSMLSMPLPGFCGALKYTHAFFVLGFLLSVLATSCNSQHVVSTTLPINEFHSA